ncbi:MAG: YbfB/YjiJ family MFS transporter [Pelomonas sp.]|nr:YbfB/YjiJ family MFS transporter [Roseateles sp.]
MAGGVAAITLALGPARFAYTPLLPLMHAEAGLSLADGGALASINYAGYISGALLVAWVESPVWRYRLYAWGLVVGVLSAALMGLASDYAVWAVARYVGGLAGAAAMLLGSGLVQGWLVRAGRRPELGVQFSGIGLAITLSALGSLAMAQLHWDWARQWWAYAALALALLVPALGWRPPVPPAPAARAASGPPRRWLAWLMASYFCAGWGFVVSATFTVAMVERQPLLSGKGALAWLLVGAAATPAVFVWDRVARRLGDIGALATAFALQIAAVLLAAFGGSLGAALGAALLYGASFTGLVSLTLALVGRHAPGNPGKAMARLTLSYGVAQVLAPALSGRLAEASGSFHSALWLTAGVLVVGLAMLARLPGAERAAR